ncbi:MAG TPA: DUF3261 domain-containing protein [Oxalicibacterium sp.]|uniref:DUF3261 domain-containing protein n=1 Tax=Oxalicibacterium sp. TaxID=2766525 RepID=UPI002BB798C7|nr:DUF3261 domain-containing protein [Oxalicibacterium sp.]HWU97904.1 DUF3261 domain-containing protein [Oxalicibacterium sp.]
MKRISIIHRVLLITTLAAMLALTGCATAPAPQSARLNLRLSPSSLGASIARQQHLKVEREGRIDELDAALEVDPDHIQLVGLAFGQRVLSLSYDGKELTSWRHVMLPSQVRAEDVLEDLQLTLWPKEAIASALPAGWTIEDDGLHRTLYMNGERIMTVEYQTMPRWSGTVVLENLRYRYRLTIQSVPAGP